MSLRHQAGINLPGYNALKVPNAPTIGTAISASGTSVSVAFTAPSCVGGGAITSYTAFACCGVKTGTAASSPVTVTGLTTGQSYTFKVVATNAYGPSYPSAASNSVVPLVVGQQAYTTAGTYTWVAPACVTSVSVVTVGGGGGGRNGFVCCGGNFSGGGGGGGALSYKNNHPVTPGNSYTVEVGVGGNAINTGGSSYFISTCTVGASGGTGRLFSTSGGNGGYVLSGTGYSGGNGGSGGFSGSGIPGGGGGGGAAGYSGNGGNGGNASNSSPTSGSNGNGGAGGGGGGSSSASRSGGSGGGVGILGSGSNGAGGSSGAPPNGGGGGSCGATGSSGTVNTNGCAGLYGGGGGGANSQYPLSSKGNAASGAVRIIWPGTTRSFPSTNTGNL